MITNLNKTDRWPAFFALLILCSFTASAQLQWVAWTGSVPDNAVVGGNENGGNQYVCRAVYNGVTHPGKVVAGNCNIGYGGNEIVLPNFEILLNLGGVQLFWERVQERRMPEGAVKVTNENSSPMWVGQAVRSDGTIQGGKILRDPQFGFICNYGYGGNEISEIRSFNVLVSRPMDTQVQQPPVSNYQQNQNYQQQQLQVASVQINNRWKPTEFIHVQNQIPASSSIDPNWITAQWVQEQVPGEAFFRLKNMARENCYLHNQNGRLECGPIDQGWWSAQWTLEQQDGQYFIIRNRWKPNEAINNQYGMLVCGPIEPGWWSAQWSLVQAPPTNSMNQPAMNNHNREENRGPRWFNSGVPTQVEIINGLITDRRMLSCNEMGNVVDLWRVNESGRQKWIFERIENQEGGHYFHIMVYGDVMGDRKYLSVSEDGTRVDLFSMDDGSGRQRWIIEPVPGGDPNLKIIRVARGVFGPRRFLSCAADGSRVDLWTEDDGSGRQRWLIKVLN